MAQAALTSARVATLDDGNVSASAEVVQFSIQSLDFVDVVPMAQKKPKVKRSFIPGAGNLRMAPIGIAALTVISRAKISTMGEKGFASPTPIASGGP